MPNRFPTYHLSPESFDKLERLADTFVKNGLIDFADEFANIDSFVTLAYEDPTDRDDHEMRITPRPRYLLEMLNCAVLDRVNREAFNRTKETLIIMPDCLSLHNPECEKVDSKYGDICRRCNDTCQARQIVDLAARYRAKAIFSKRKLSKQLDHYKDKSRDLGVVGIACILMLAEGLRTADSEGIPARGVILNGCGCEHWNDKPFASTVIIERVRRILEEKHDSRD